ncbi:MAG: amidohydrolase [Wenzhouxiangellaceae bacterium]
MAEPVSDLQPLRHSLHQSPELSGQEHHTAATIAAVLSTYGPDELLTGIAGHGVMAIFKGHQPGPHILLRCELDALPIRETNRFDYCSVHPGVAHKCGHDGHMTILLEVARRLQQQPLVAGRVQLLFQPAEETGLGAVAVCRDEQYLQHQPEHVFALHNMPGYPLGSVIVRPGTMCCASRGVIIRLSGKTAHAGQPETGIAPTAAVISLLQLLPLLAQPFADQELAMITVVGARLGDKTFGNTPGQAEIYLTLRSEHDATLATLEEQVRLRTAAVCAEQSLQHEFSYEDYFPATVNHPAGVEQVRAAAAQCQAELIPMPAPMRWSEDFGYYTQQVSGALFGLGAGEDHADLHNPDYDFPDQLINIGADLFLGIVQQLQAPH